MAGLVNAFWIPVFVKKLACLVPQQEAENQKFMFQGNSREYGSADTAGLVAGPYTWLRQVYKPGSTKAGPPEPPLWILGPP